MSHTLSRVLLAAALIILLPFFYVQSFAFTTGVRGISHDTALLIAFILTAALFAGGWILIWRRCVRWTLRRVVWTGVAAIAGLVPGVLILSFDGILGDTAIAIIQGAGCWGAVWAAATAFIWRENAQERVDRAAATGGIDLNCPQCGYSMRGLHEARCPECGTLYTLDGLIAKLQDARGEFR